MGNSAFLTAPRTMAQTAGEGFDWGQVGAIIVSIATGALGAIGTLRGFRKPDDPKPPAPTPVADPVSGDDVRAIEILQGLVTTLGHQNDALFKRNAEYQARIDDLEQSLNDLRREVQRLRNTLIEHRIDPG